MVVPITPGSGGASVAAEAVGGFQYQQIEVYGGGGSSVLSVNPDGSFKASIIGTPTVTFSGSPSISGAVTITNAPSIYGNISGSVVSFQGGIWNNSVAGAVQIAGGSPASIATVQRLDIQVIGSNLGLVTNTVMHGLTSAGGGGYVDVKVDPSGALVTTASSIVTFQGGTQITSVISSTPSSMLSGASIFGQLPGGTATLGSIVGIQGTNPYIVVGSVYGSGSVVSFQGGTNITSLVSTVPSSVQVGVSIFGQLPGGNAVLGAVAASISGTVTTAQSGTVTTSIVGGASVFQTGTWSPSAIGYVFRNDTTASTLGADLSYHQMMGDSQGRVINKPFVSNDATLIEFSTSVVSTSVTLIQASAIGKRSYVTDFWISNTGATTTLVTFKDGSTSVLGYTIAPTGGGSNSQGINLPWRTAPSQDLTFAATSGTSILFLTVRGYQGQ